MSRKKPWLIEVSREQTAQLIVMAETAQQAEADARELAAVLLRDDGEFDATSAYAVSRTPVDRRKHRYEPVWSGGPDGAWL